LAVAGVPQLLDLAFELGNRLFEIEEIRIHSGRETGLKQRGEV
jgi:hypothetical protein